MDFRLQNAADVERLAPPKVIPEKLAYTASALRLLRKELGPSKALLGFCGSPWTLACYMVEGGSPGEAETLRRLFLEDRDCFDRLMETLTNACATYLRLQAEAGADAVQIFDSWAAHCPGNLYLEMSAQWISGIIARLPKELPVIVFPKGMTAFGSWFARAGASVLGVDTSADIGQLRHQMPGNLALQGNLDPFLLETTPEIVRHETRRLLQAVKGHPGHILNLGHGIRPRAHISCVEAFLEEIES
jgi:uroporphyrinogen decarboxylase